MVCSTVLHEQRYKVIREQGESMNNKQIKRTHECCECYCEDGVEERLKDCNSQQNDFHIKPLLGVQHPVIIEFNFLQGKLMQIQDIEDQTTC